MARGQQSPGGLSCLISRSTLGSIPRPATIVLLFLTYAFIGLAFAKPPPGSDLNGLTHLWFEALKNRAGMHCCSEADCHVLKSNEWRRDIEGYEVLINERWTRVKPDNLTTEVSIFTAPVGCWSSAGYLYCFAPSLET